MKKIILSSLVIILILTLTGCGPHFLDGTGTEDADCAEQTVMITGGLLSIGNMNWLNFTV